MSHNIFIHNNICHALEYISRNEIQEIFFVKSNNAQGKRKEQESITRDFLSKRLSITEEISIDQIKDYSNPGDIFFSWDSFDEAQIIRNYHLKSAHQNRLLDNFDFNSITTFTPFRKKVEKNLPTEFTQGIYQQKDEELERELHYYFYDTHLAKNYFEIRNGVLGRDYSTKLSQYLSNGRLNVRYLYNYISNYEKEFGSNKSTYWIKFEILWREFFYWSYQKNKELYFSLHGLDGFKRFDRQLERKDFKELFSKDPFMSAVYQELIETGYISNRFRQVFASSFINTYKIDWRIGADLFEKYLIDYDVYSNWGNWQYLAGVGHDPRGQRVFNVLKQLSTYDSELSHIRHWTNYKDKEEILNLLKKIYT